MYEVDPYKESEYFPDIDFEEIYLRKVDVHACV